MVKKLAPVNFKKGFSEYVAANPKVWEHDRSTTVGASEVFGCHRRSFFKKRKPELAEAPPEDVEDRDWGKMERGNVLEDSFVVPALQHMFGDDNCLFMGQKNQKTLVDEKLSATPDGCVINQPRDVLAEYGIDDIGADEFAPEIKTFSIYTAPPANKAKAQHIGQNICQLGLIRKHTNYNPGIGVVIYVNASDLRDVRPRVVQFEQDIYDRAKRRAADVFDVTKAAKDFQPEGKMTGDCNICEFCTACNSIEIDANKENIGKKRDLTPEATADLIVLTKNVAELRAEAKIVESRKKLAEMELKDKAIHKFGVQKFKEGDVTFSISESKGRSSVSKDLLLTETVDRDLLVERLTKLGGGHLEPEVIDVIDSCVPDLDKFSKTGDPFLVLRAKAGKEED